MKKTITITFLLVFLLFTQRGYTQVSPVEFVHDPVASATLEIEKGIEAEELIIKTTEYGQDGAQAISLMNILKESKRHLQTLQKVTNTIRQMSQYKEILDNEINILNAYKEANKEILRNRKLSSEERKLIKELYKSILDDTRKILHETSNIFLKSSSLNMYDGSRIKLLNSQREKLNNLLQVAYAVNSRFGNEINRRTRIEKQLYKIKGL